MPLIRTHYGPKNKRVFAENMVGLGFLDSFLYQTDPNARKVNCCGKKVAQMSLLTHFFLGWVGLGVGEFVGFIILHICCLTQQNLVNRKPRNVFPSVHTACLVLVITYCVACCPVAAARCQLLNLGPGETACGRALEGGRGKEGQYEQLENRLLESTIGQLNTRETATLLCTCVVII